MEEPRNDEERPEEPAPALPEEPQTSVQFQPLVPTPQDEPEGDGRGEP